MRGKGRGRVGALNRLLPRNSTDWTRLRDAASDIITASDKTRVFPLCLGGASVTQVGRVLWRGRVVMYSVGMVRVWLILSTLGTVQDTSADSGGTWSSTSSNSVIVRVSVCGTANFRHAVCFSRRRELDRILVVGISIMAGRAVSVVVKVGVVCSGSSFRGGKRNVLVELLRTPTADHRCNDKDQYSESHEPDHAKCAGDSTGVVEEAFAAALHDASRCWSRSDDGGDDHCVTIGNGKEC